MRALSPAVNDPATAVQVLDTIESPLQLLVSRELDVAGLAGSAGTVRVVLALPSWDDYLRTALDDLIESASQSPIVLLRVRALLTTLRTAMHSITAMDYGRDSGEWDHERSAPPCCYPHGQTG